MIGIDVRPTRQSSAAKPFAHEAGIHQDGRVKHRLTYEIMSAETVGWDGVGIAARQALGAPSALRAKTEALGTSFR